MKNSRKGILFKLYLLRILNQNLYFLEAIAEKLEIQAYRAFGQRLQEYVTEFSWKFVYTNGRVFTYVTVHFTLEAVDL